MRGRNVGLGLAFLLCVAALPRRATAVDERLPLRIGAPPGDAALRARSTPDGLLLEVRGSGPPARALFPASAEARLEVESVRLSSGAEVAVVRVVDGSARFAAMVSARRGRPVILWQGRLDFVGDPGERRGAAIELEDRTGDGFPDLIVGSVREDTFLCGQPPALLEPRAVHPETLELRPVVLRRLAELPPGSEQTVAPSSVSPGPAERPLVDALHFRRASSIAGLPAGAPVTAPVGIGDGDASTAWVEGAGSGTYEFATAGWAGGAGLPIRAFSIVPRPAGSLAASTRAPAAVWLVGDQGPRLRVELPADAPPGARYWIVPSAPLRWSCVSVVLDAGPQGGGHVAIAELEAYSDIDFGGGVEQLVAELSAGAARADRAEALLGQMGLPARDALAAALPDMPAAERVRAVRALARIARQHPPALDTLGRAVLDGSREVSVAARRALLALGPAGARALAAVAAEEPTGEALMELAERHATLAIEPTLAAMASPGGSDRPALRRVLALCAREAPGPTVAAIDARQGERLEVLAAIAEALAAAGEPAREAAIGALAELLAPDAPFETRFRAARAAASLAPGGLPSEVVAFLDAQARTAEEWMMRAEALRALAALPEPPRGLLVAALDDAYPRVRAAAIEASASIAASDRSAAVKLAELARRDPHPFVRAAAVRTLGPIDVARPVVEAALGDHAERVRAAAIETFAAQRDAAAWPRIEERLRDEDEWPVVTDAAIGFARDLCVARAVDALGVVLERAARPRTWDPDLTSAGLAVEALAALGTPEARAILVEAAARPETGVGRTAEQALERPATCGTTAPPPGP